MTPRVLVARLDSDGEVLLAGPAVRAAAASGEVVLMCGPRGRQAADLLPGVARVLEWPCPWIVPHPAPVRPHDMTAVVARLAELRPHVALVLTSSHQSPLPLALMLRMAGVPRVAAICAEYAGSLLDVRLRPDIDLGDELSEPERALAVAEAAGFHLPEGDDGSLAVRPPADAAALTGLGGYVVVHPGASVPARAWSPARCAALVAELSRRGRRVVVTGGPGERALTSWVAGPHGRDLGGRTTFEQLAGVLAGADAVVVGNTGPAHLAAAVGTPVVSLFAPAAPACHRDLHRLPHALLGDQHVPCRGDRARACPVPGRPCLSSATPAEAATAVESLVGCAHDTGATALVRNWDQLSTEVTR
ncbi:MAG TPA: glycosyltransferase family 9 protein [Pseudonocardiaceae bacterium]|jgi:ADP-heptose:LPS heptosyltransferase|nr:glycosyltransferase family 9 protein [Pseudonocardiaceae bacterium]